MSNPIISLDSLADEQVDRVVAALESIAKSMEKLSSPQIVVNVPSTSLDPDEISWTAEHARLLKEELA